MVDRIQREIFIDAAVERVWELITQAEHVQVWFAFDGADIDLRPGGALVHNWKEHGTFRGVIEQVDRPTVFSYRYSSVPDEEPRPGYQTLVTFTLAAADGGTRLVVVESGFDELAMDPEQRRMHIQGTTDGWAGGLSALRERAATLEHPTPRP
ncbi:SRPBCC family protein [Plantactinospora mayteni]|uniref:Toxin n=1 Tax=Plantactinospora mayteni TaxID=566021 RepID=A0ABQ4F0P9_9ACTN|nr:SRPBCC domain-containing protein [Plantactinospora mayteni]GIH00486.1 toxin [Plantactinospora mayteni]